MSTSSETPRILLVGASGYIGGTVLHYLLESSHPVLSRSTITVLIRGQDRAQKLTEAHGDRVHPIVFDGLDDTARVAAVASEHDVVVSAALGFHLPGARALVQGLAARRRQSDGDGSTTTSTAAASGRGRSSTRLPWIIHLSGVSNIADAPPLGEDHPGRRFDDADARAVYEHERGEEARAPYLQRTTELAVLDDADEAGVGAIAMQAPAVWGIGRGLFAVAPSMLSIMLRFILEKGYAFQLGDGTACIGVVHIDDLARFFVLLTEKILDDGGKGLSSGKDGILYAQTGTATMRRLATGCLDAAFRHGVLPKPSGPPGKEVRVIDIDEAAAWYGGGEFGKTILSKAYAGHMNTTATVAGRLGWKPLHGMDELYADSNFDEELVAMLDGKRNLGLAATASISTLPK